MITEARAMTVAAWLAKSINSMSSKMTNFIRSIRMKIKMRGLKLNSKLSLKTNKILTKRLM